MRDEFRCVRLPNLFRIPYPFAKITFGIRRYLNQRLRAQLVTLIAVDHVTKPAHPIVIAFLLINGKSR
jgi:hypothetical protein